MLLEACLTISKVDLDLLKVVGINILPNDCLMVIYHGTKLKEKHLKRIHSIDITKDQVDDHDFSSRQICDLSSHPKRVKMHFCSTYITGFCIGLYRDLACGDNLAPTKGDARDFFRDPQILAGSSHLVSS